MEYIYEVMGVNPRYTGKEEAKEYPLHVTTNFDEALTEKSLYIKRGYTVSGIKVTSDKLKESPIFLVTNTDLGIFREGLERAAAWKRKTRKAIPVDPTTEEPFDFFKEEDGFHVKENTKEVTNLHDIIQEMEKRGVKKDPINPSHYKEYMVGYQWLEATCRKKKYIDNPDKFEGFLEITIDKYLSRAGKKGEDPHEDIRKALWYIEFLLAWKENGRRPILVSDVEKLLNEKARR